MSARRIGMLGVVLVLGVLSGACSRGAHAAAAGTLRTSPPVLLAQTTCWNTMSCCIQRNPTTAAESCGATATEILDVLHRASMVSGEAPSSETTEAAGEKDSVPAWRRKCMSTYNKCINRRWIGTRSCSDCLHNCIGQREWPKEWCFSAEED